MVIEKKITSVEGLHHQRSQIKSSKSRAAYTFSNILLMDFKKSCLLSSSSITHSKSLQLTVEYYD